MEETKERKDVVEKEFVAFPDVAADVINVLLYQGKMIANKSNLRTGPTEFIYQESGKLRSEYEDLCKYELKDGKVNIMYLIANQSRTDGKMLLRKAGYTGGAYRAQYGQKMDEIYPVIEFVLYWGKARWGRCRDIRRLFEKKIISEEAWEYIDELKLHIFEMRYLPEETRKLFQSDMWIVADFLAEGEGYRSDRKVIHKAALIRMIQALSGEVSVPEGISGEMPADVEKWMEERGIREEDEITVCELFDQYVRQGEKKGKAGQLVQDVENAMRFFQVTLEKACEGLGTTVEGYQKAKNSLL